MKSRVTFINMRDMMIEHIKQMFSSADRFYETDVDKEEMLNLYQNSFPEGSNPIFRERRTHDCSCCSNFIKNIGSMIMINEDGTITTIWDFKTNDDIYQPVLDSMSAYVKSKKIKDVYVSISSKIGVLENYEYETTKGKLIHTWNHFFTEVPSRFTQKNLCRGYNSIEDYKSTMRSTKDVFKRSLDEITQESVETVLELINQGSLYRGEEHKVSLELFLEEKKTYSTIDSKYKDIYAWDNFQKVGPSVSKIRNTSIGTLLIDLSEGMDLDSAVTRYEKIVAPSNYKRPKAIFTKRMLDEAKKTIEELGYMDSLPRRHATLDDISVTNILFSNKDASRRIKNASSIFDEMEKDTVGHGNKKFGKVEEISIEKFISDVLPTVKELEAFIENKHAPNLVSLIAPVNTDSKNMFKWSNNFGWSYSGNITDSDIRDRVKSLGGNVDGVLRFSIQWNDGDDYNNNDFDAHCLCPTEHIYYGLKKDIMSEGWLDVDIMSPTRGVPAVENIAFPQLSKMPNGDYEFSVKCYSNRGGRSGFKAEIEFDGNIYKFEYNKELRSKEVVSVATVTLKDGVFSIKPHLDSTTTSRNLWGVDTNQFVPVTVMCYSPNYWDDQNGIGHKHYFFMLKDCINPEEPNGFYNEFLKQELVSHKRVFEALGSKMKVEHVEDQLSGLGFSSTKRNDLIVKVKGSSERVLKIKF